MHASSLLKHFVHGRNNIEIRVLVRSWVQNNILSPVLSNELAGEGQHVHEPSGKPTDLLRYILDDSTFYKRMAQNQDHQRLTADLITDQDLTAQ